MPETENSGLAPLTELIESARLPVLVSTTDWDVELFIARVPKSSEAGESVSLGAAFSPAPESGTRIGAFKSADEITSEPLSSTAAGGLKTTLRLRWLPGA